MKKVHLVQAEAAEDAEQRVVLPEQVQLSLLEIGGAAKEGLMALAVGAGLAVLHECMEDEVDQVVGPKGRQPCESNGEASRAQRRRGDARRPPRADQPPARQDGRR